MMIRTALAAALLAAAAAGAAQARQPPTAPVTPAGREALEILKQAVATPTVQGRGQVPVLAAALRERLLAAGFRPEDVRFHPLGETGWLEARYPGRERAAKPIVLLGHLDVVEARREDWARDPFTQVVEGGYLYGRGALDNKGDVSVLLATLMKLKREGWTPRRDLVVALTGDEETAMATTQAAAEALKGAELVLNADAGGGLLGEDGKPAVYGVQAAEKTYADYRLVVTDPGGHSSRPGRTNAIYRLGAALARLEAHRFPTEISPVTRQQLLAASATTPAPVGPALRAFAANPKDAAAAAVIAAEPEFTGWIRTTCVATEIKGGHAPNALPQRAEATVNCRIFPGTSMAAVREVLQQVVADAGVAVTQLEAGSVAAPESPLRPDVTAAVTAAVGGRAPGLAVTPMMESGATDSMWFRALGVPAYGVSTVFLKASDNRAHGLDERLPLATLDPGAQQWERLLKALAK